MTIDIKDFYLNTPMDRNEYMRLKLSDLPEDFAKEYDLASKVTKDVYVYVETRREMYGLPHAGLIAQQLLENASTRKAISKVNALLFSGRTLGAPSPSRFVWTIQV